MVRSSRWRFVAVPLLVVLLVAAASAQTRLAPPGEPRQQLGAVRFVEVAAQRGLLPATPAVGMGTGAAAADVDGDGDIDLFVPNGAGHANQFYRNDGAGNFSEVAAQVGLDQPYRDRVGLWFDYDGDHDLDLVVANDDALDETTFRLYRQESGGQFSDVTQAAGLRVQAEPNLAAHRGGLCAGDVNGDGWLDLYAASWSAHAFLFLNEGDGTFREVSESAGLRPFLGRQWQPMMLDVNGDGRLDIYVAVDFTDNLLWINQGDGTFVDRAAEAGVDVVMNDMGMAIADDDSDGDLDLYTSNVYDYLGLGEHNILLRNDSIGDELSFRDVTEEVGVGDGGWGWGVTTLDVDLDGRLDFAATNGFFRDSWFADSSRLWVRPVAGAGPCRELARSTGLGDRDWGSCLLALDFDRDGDQDLLQTCMDAPPKLLENRSLRGVRDLPNSHRYLVVQPRMNGPNHRAIGAVVTVEVAGVARASLISAGTSFLGQEPAEAFFGCGSASVVDRVTVEFPDGTRRVWHDVPTDQVVQVRP